MQALAGRPVRLVTYDTAMGMRGRHVGLRVHRKEGTAQPRRRRGREPKGGDRDAEVEHIGDPAERTVRAGELISVRQQSIGHLSRIRRTAMEEMLADGLTHSQIADQTGLTRQQVGQLLAEPPATRD